TSSLRRRGRGGRGVGYKYLIFPNSLAESYGFRAVIGIENWGENHQLCLRLLDEGFGPEDLLVDAKLVEAVTIYDPSP
ncbi:MAG TPA: hypothetical protein VHA30_00940, partial [Patescibacteria group bacterium]|nr:hypothetical protein [Patescibacteria group bacterium]